MGGSEPWFPAGPASWHDWGGHTGPQAQKGPHLVECPIITIWKFQITLKEGVLYCHFAWDPANNAAGPGSRDIQLTKCPKAWVISMAQRENADWKSQVHSARHHSRVPMAHCLLCSHCNSQHPGDEDAHRRGQNRTGVPAGTQSKLESPPRGP